MDEAVIVMDSCLGDTWVRRVRNGPEFCCDPDSDRMLCRTWIPSTMDMSVREVGVTVCLMDISADIDSGTSVIFLAHQWCRPSGVGITQC